MVNFMSVLLILVGSVIGSYGTLIVKKGTNQHAFRSLLTSWQLWFGLFLYGLAVIFYVFALRAEELSVVYPLVSISYIWTTLFSVKLLGEKMNQWKWIGLLGIILGIVLIGIGS